MNKKQKILLVVTTITIILVIAIVGLFSANLPENGKIKVVATFYPLAFLSQEIGGDYIEVTQLVSSNTEIHSWEPSASHILAAENADMIVFNGAGLDHWLEDDVLTALSSNKKRTAVDTTHGLDLLMGEEHEHEEQSGEEEHEHGLYDPHTWVSPYMAKLQAQKIYDALVQIDPQHESDYTQRWQALEEKLAGLDENYTVLLSNARKDAIFVSHEAFGYLDSLKVGLEAT